MRRNLLCQCPRDALCRRCSDSLFMQLKGTAANRGERWARDVPTGHVWPDYGGKCRDIALRLVSDLTRDATLQERLAVELWGWAKRTYGR